MSKQRQVEPVAHCAGDQDRPVHVGERIRNLRIDDAMADSVGRTDKHLRDDDHDERQRNRCPQADKGLRQRLEENHIPEDAKRRGAHRARRKDAGLPRIHDAVGNVEDDHEPSGEGRDCDLGDVPQSEQQQKQRKHRGRRRRAEEVDQKFDRAINRRLGAQHDSDRNACHDGDQDRIGYARRSCGRNRQSSCRRR